jgi:hypothetical protein
LFDNLPLLNPPFFKIPEKVFYSKWKPQKKPIDHNLRMSELVAAQASLLLGLGRGWSVPREEPEFYFWAYFSFSSFNLTTEGVTGELIG